MKTKFLLPVLAAIFAIGMSFTTVDKMGDPNTDYILVNGNFESLNMEVNCGSGTEICQVRLEPDGPIYEVYDAEDPSTLKQGDGNIRNLF